LQFRNIVFIANCTFENVHKKFSSPEDTNGATRRKQEQQQFYLIYEVSSPPKNEKHAKIAKLADFLLRPNLALPSRRSSEV
jgi:hypothetical protein